MQRNGLNWKERKSFPPCGGFNYSWNVPKSAFEDVTDESLIDSYIYEIIALQKKYEYFLRAAKRKWG